MVATPAFASGTFAPPLSSRFARRWRMLPRPTFKLPRYRSSLAGTPRNGQTAIEVRALWLPRPAEAVWPLSKNGPLMRGREDGRPFGRSFSSLVRPCGRPSGGLASLRGRCRPMRPAGSVEARTWGIISQPHTVTRPIRHRRPSLIPGAHQVSRKGDGAEYGGGKDGVDKGGVKFL